MLGPAKHRHLDQPIAISLEALVPANHFYRHLEVKLPLGFVRECVRGLYAERGRPSIDPVVFFKNRILFFAGIRSERKLIETASLDKLRGYHTTATDQQAMRKRQVWVEPLFAEAKAWHGVRRFRLRGLINANIPGLLIAAGQNLKRGLAATGWRRRHAPCGSLVTLPREPGRLSTAYGF